MADALKTTIAAGATNSSLTTLTEHGSVVVGMSGRVIIEHELDTGIWQALYDGSDCRVIDYAGQSLRITNPGTVAINIRVGQK